MGESARQQPESGNKPGGDGSAQVAEAPPKRKRVRLIAGGVILTVLIGVGIWYWLNAGLEKTDNAEIDADIVPVRAQTGGIVEKVLFQDNQLVAAGDVLIEIQRKPHEIALAEAEAHLAEAKASLAAADAEVQRLELTSPGELLAATAQITQTRAAVAVVDASVKEAKAKRDEAKRELSRTKALFADKATTQVKLEVRK